MGSQQGGIGMGQIAAALAPIVIAMLTNRSGSPSAGTGSQAGAGAGGGGLGGILGQILGGGSGASGGGGLGDLLDQFQRAGYGEQAKSWVGTGENQPISPDDLSQVFGKGGISEIARRAGLTEEQASTGLSQLLPEVVDRVTPQGEVPASDQLVRSVDDLTRRLGLG
jgi:uncharacterized protein YidB (DUF937 family)